MFGKKKIEIETAQGQFTVIGPVFSMYRSPYKVSRTELVPQTVDYCFCDSKEAADVIAALLNNSV